MEQALIAQCSCAHSGHKPEKKKKKKKTYTKAHHSNELYGVRAAITGPHRRLLGPSGHFLFFISKETSHK